MLQIEANGILKAYGNLACLKTLLSVNDHRGGAGLDISIFMSGEEAAHALAGALGQLGFAGAAAYAFRTSEQFRQIRGHSETVGTHNGRDVLGLSGHDVQVVLAGVSQLLLLVSTSLHGHVIFVLEGKNLSYWRGEEKLSDEAQNAFSEAAAELEEAAMCIAFERWTASVVHCMRALESALVFLCSRLDITPKNPNWENVINDIISAVNKMTAANHGDGWKGKQQVFAAAAAHLRLVQRAWRNHAAHGHARYNENEAKAIFGNVFAFLEDLARAP